MVTLLLFDGNFDWGAIAQGGIGSLVVMAVFVIIIRPIIEQFIESYKSLISSVSLINNTISEGNKEVLKAIDGSEDKLIERFVSTIENNVISKEGIKQIQEALARIEKRLD